MILKNYIKKTRIDIRILDSYEQTSLFNETISYVIFKLQDKKYTAIESTFITLLELDENNKIITEKTKHFTRKQLRRYLKDDKNIDKW